MTNPKPDTCDLCGTPVQRVPMANAEDWWWRPLEPTTDTVMHAHYSTGTGGHKRTQAEMDALPLHCGWVLWRGPSGWWCRQCDRPIPEQGDWNPQRAAIGLVYSLVKGTTVRASLQELAATQPALALLRALHHAGEHGDARALHWEMPARAALATLHETPDPWEALRQHLVRGPWTTDQPKPTTLQAAQRRARAHNTKKLPTRMHVVPVPTSDPAAEHGWLTITREDHQ